MLQLPDEEPAGAGEDEVEEAGSALAELGPVAGVPQDAVLAAQVGDGGQLSTLDTHGRSVLDFDALFRAYHHRLLVQALSLHAPSAEDAVAEAWLVAVRDRDRYDGTIGRPVAWLIALVKYAALRQVRDRIRRIADNIDLLGDELEERDRGTPYPGLEDPETHAAWAQVVPYLSQRQAVAVWLRCIGGYTVDEAAQEMGVSKTVVDTASKEGLRKIARFFGEGERFDADGCKRCGWPRASIGHATSCGRTDRHNRPVRSTRSSAGR